MNHYQPPREPVDNETMNPLFSPSAFAFRKLSTQIADLYERKNKDYSDSFSKTYAQFGIISALSRISDKYHRVCELGLSNEQKIKDETIRDTLLDLASYSLMTVMELDKPRKEGTNAID